MRSTGQRAVLVAMVAALSVAGCATQGDMPASGESRSVSEESGKSTASPGRPASGTAGDSLQACMSRIPSDASAGQRMMAEQSCQRDEAGRKAIMAVPGAK